MGTRTAIGVTGFPRAWARRAAWMLAGRIATKSTIKASAAATRVRGDEEAEGAEDLADPVK